MINKLICFIFGHKLREKIPDELNYYLQWTKWHWEWFKVCPRCGKKLTENN